MNYHLYHLAYKHFSGIDTLIEKYFENKRSMIKKNQLRKSWFFPELFPPPDIFQKCYIVILLINFYLKVARA